MNTVQLKHNVSKDPELTSYFKQQLQKIEERAPSDAVVSGLVKDVADGVEATIRVSSPYWQSACRKCDSNPYMAIDMAIGEMNESLSQRRDAIDWTIF